MDLNFYGTRRLADRIRRRALISAGKPDNTPWVVTPRTPHAKPAYVDFIFALEYLSPNSKLMSLFQEAMAPYGLTMLLVNGSNAAQVLQQIKSGLLRPHVYLDLCSHPGEIFEELLFAADAAGCRAIRRKDQTNWVLKHTSHLLFEKAGLRLPPTILIKPDDPDRELTDAERAIIGEKCVIKPSFGEAGKGVRLNRVPTAEVIAQARDFNRKDHWLVQKMLTWVRYGERPAYFRAYNVLGHRTMLWWSAERAGYSTLTWSDVQKYDLIGIFKIIDRIAELTGMDYFSSEVCCLEESGPDRFCLVDYANDQCDIDPAGSPSGSPPEAWVKWVCARFAEFTWRLKHGLNPNVESEIFLLPEQSQ